MPMADDPDIRNLTLGARSAAPEAVDHPSHYGGRDNPFEVIKVMEAWLTREEFIGAMKFNIIKYQVREGKKNGAQDCSKSAWYANYLEDYLKRNPA